MDEISVGCMYFDDLDSRGERPFRGRDKILDHGADFHFAHFHGGRVAGVKRNRARRERLPSSVGYSDGRSSLPGDPRTAFTACVSELDTRDRSVIVQQSNDAREFLDVPVFPQTQIRRGNTSARFDGSCFRENQAGPADSA